MGYVKLLQLSIESYCLSKLKIARMQCIAVFANMQTKNASCVNQIAVTLYIIVCPLQYLDGALYNDIAN